MTMACKSSLEWHSDAILIKQGLSTAIKAHSYDEAADEETKGWKQHAKKKYNDNARQCAASLHVADIGP
ncbi:hypothetical protein AB4Z21_09850 [Paenibacillus sp. MCAF20]